MSKSQDEGGPAFPNPSASCSGMSLRDWFAGHALAGLITIDPQQLEGAFDEEGFYEAVCAKAAYNLADAMLAERAKK